MYAMCQAHFSGMTLFVPCLTPGYALTQGASGTVTSSLSALASGTFLYVAVFEVIPKELADSSHKIAKLTAMSVGFGLMSLLAIWA